MATILPPSEVFAHTPDYSKDDPVPEQIGAFEITGWYKTTCPPEGGMYAYNHGRKFPRKGHVYEEAVITNNHVKRFLLACLLPLARKEMILPALGFLLTPFRWKVSFLENALIQLGRFADSAYLSVTPIPYLKRQYYNACSRELWTLLFTLLRELGISFDTAYKTGKILATVIEYDEAYRLRLEDVLTETTKEALMRDPGGELSRLIGIYATREKATGDDHIGGRMLKLGKLLKMALMVPRIRKAFVTAVNETEFSGLQLDETDRYYCLNRPEYDFFGYSFTDRFTLYIHLHPELIAPPAVQAELNHSYK